MTMIDRVRIAVLLAVLPAVLSVGCAGPRDPGLAPSLGLDISTFRSTSAGLLIRDDRVGTGEEARAWSTVVVHYTGWLADGTRFESSRDRGAPLVTPLGRESRLVVGWAEGMLGMREGGRRTLVIPPALAYGARGVPGTIPPNATLVFELELLDVRGP